MRYGPCIAGMLSFDGALKVPYDGFQLEHPVLRWAARNSSKPNREDDESWVIHSGPEWSQAHFDAQDEFIKSELVRAFADVVGAQPELKSFHRWRYALAHENTHPSAFYEATLGLGIGGDGLGGPRVENAWLSGQNLAQQVIAAEGG